MPYTIGLYTAFALAKTDPQIVKSGDIVNVSNIPAKLITKYGVHAKNHKAIVIKAICKFKTRIFFFFKKLKIF